MTATIIRQPAVAGMFYPAGRDALDGTVDRLLTQESGKPVGGSIVALIVPHAGYQYSGPTAAAGFRLLMEEKFDCVVIVSPSHREYFDGVAVYSGSAYNTPLGNLPVEEQLRDALIAGDEIIEVSARGHRQEHAIEVQLPFIQKTLGSVSILPIVMGDQKREYCFHLGERLAEILKEKHVLLVASTDLSHYHPYEVARELDKIIVTDISRFDYMKMMLDLESEKAEACGGGPAVAVLSAASRLGANRVRILHQCNSGDVTGDHSAVVGYMSAAILHVS